MYIIAGILYYFIVKNVYKQKRKKKSIVNNNESDKEVKEILFFLFKVQSRMYQTIKYKFSIFKRDNLSIP